MVGLWTWAKHVYFMFPQLKAGLETHEFCLYSPINHSSPRDVRASTHHVRASPCINAGFHGGNHPLVMEQFATENGH